jgi:predicted sugar kinase
MIETLIKDIIKALDVKVDDLTQAQNIIRAVKVQVKDLKAAWEKGAGVSSFGPTEYLQEDGSFKEDEEMVALYKQILED